MVLAPAGRPASSWRLFSAMRAISASLIASSPSGTSAREASSFLICACISFASCLCTSTPGEGEAEATRGGDDTGELNGDWESQQNGEQLTVTAGSVSGLTRGFIQRERCFGIRL